MTTSAIWGKFYPVSENSSTKWYLYFEFNMIDNVDVYLPDQHGQYQKIETGNRRHFHDRVFNHRKLIIPFKPDKTPSPVFFRLITGEDAMDIQASVTSEKGLLDTIEFETFIFAKYYLIAGSIFLLILLVYGSCLEMKNMALENDLDLSENKEPDHLDFISPSPQTPLLGIFSSKEFSTFRQNIQTLKMQGVALGEPSVQGCSGSEPTLQIENIIFFSEVLSTGKSRKFFAINYLFF